MKKVERIDPKTYQKSGHVNKQYHPVVFNRQLV